MAFFSLTDIKYVSGQNREFQINSNRYGTNNMRYPIDLGGTDKGHYMMFNIFVQERTQAIGYKAGGDMLDASGVAKVLEKPIDNGASAGQFLFKKILAKVDESIANKYNDDKELGGSSVDITEQSLLGGIKNIGNNLLSRGNFFRTIKKTNDTITLYMPDTLAFDYAQAYSDLSVSKDLGVVGGLLSAGASIFDGREKTGAQTIKNIAPFAAEIVKNKSPFGGNVLFSAINAASGGALAVNPQLELIYEGTGFRNFRFSFMFYPRSKKEAEEVLKIIESFTYHQAPEVLSSSFGRYLVPPSEFDISFYYNGKENPNIPKISTCVLTGLNVDYAPNGFASYETLSNEPEKAGTGMPVAIRMELGFKETQIITKQFLKGENFEAYKSPFKGDESINGLTFGNEGSVNGGEPRTQPEIDASNALRGFNETGITFTETTVTDSFEVDGAKLDWSDETNY